MEREGFWRRLFGGHRPDDKKQPAEESTERPIVSRNNGQPAPTRDSVSTVYAEALLQLSEQHDRLDEIARHAADLATLLASDAALRRLLASPVISVADRRGLIERVFRGRVEDVLYRFLQVVNQKGRLGALENILATFAALLDEKRGIVKVNAYVATPLDAAQAEHVAGVIGATLGGKTVTLRQHVDPELIGGLKLQIGDEMIDASVATRLKMMRKRLVEASHDKARSLTAIQE